MQQLRTAAGPPAARVRAAQPVARALLPQWLARLVGLVALGCVGVLEWQRLIGGYGSARALVWVLGAVAAALLVLLAGRARPGWRRAGALTAAALLGLVAGYLVSGAPLHFLKPRHWDELASGFGDGVQALGTVALPYRSADTWPRIALELLGAQLLVLAGLLTFWPRAADGRAPDRGFQFLALAALLVLVASPVVSIGGTRSLALGLVLAGLTVAFLWLERLPLRPGLGVAALLGVALAGALPLAAVADRGQPWFDYRSFAENLGPDDPVRFSWAQTYGPITWPRDGNEVMRVSSAKALYWKARDLDVFDGRSWTVRSDRTPLARPRAPAWQPDVPRGAVENPDWTDTISVDVRRMRTTDVIGAGTILRVVNPSRAVHPGLAAGTWDSAGPLHRGDSYTVQVRVPRPNPIALSLAASGRIEPPAGDLTIVVPFRPGFTAADRGVGVATRRVRQALLHVKGWSDRTGISYASYPSAQRADYDVTEVMANSLYARTWALAKRLHKDAETPYQYVLAVNRFLHGREFVYSERPRQPPAGEPALDFFLNVSHQGYCQHYAGAMALLLRMGGIPARVVTGFSPGGFSGSRNQWIVRDTDAHAWVEAWFDRFGWVTFDPTPGATPARSRIFATTAGGSPAKPGSVLARPTPGADGGNGTRDPEGGPGGIGLLRDRELAESRGATSRSATSLWWLVPLALIVLALPSAWALALWRAPRGATPMDRAVAELEAALRMVGRPVRTGTTLSQLERRLGQYSPEVKAYLHALTAGRYAPAPAPPARGGRRALRRALAQGLGPAGRLRALWALPPRVR